MSDLQPTIDAAWESRSELSPGNAPAAVREAVAQVIAELDAGRLRVAEKRERRMDDASMDQEGRAAVVPACRQHADGVRRQTARSGHPCSSSTRCRPSSPGFDAGAVRRRGRARRPAGRRAPRRVHRPQRRADAFLREHRRVRRRRHDGRHLGNRRLVRADRQERASVGRRGHRRGAGAACRPIPTIIEDNCFIGARSEVVEGVIVEENSVLGMGVFLGQSTKIYDRATGETIYGRVPAGSVVVAGSLPSGEGQLQPVLRGHREAGRREDAREDQHQRAAARVKHPAEKLADMSVNLKSRRSDIEKMRVAGRLAAEVLDYHHAARGSRHHHRRARIDSVTRTSVDVQGTVPATAQLRAAGPRALPGIGVHVGQSRRLPRHSGRQEAEGRRHRQHRRHRDQGRLPRRHEPDVLRRRAVDPGASASSTSPTKRCGAAFAPCGPARTWATSAHTIQRYAEGNGFSVVREFCGHGIGRQFHEEPQVLHYGRPGTGLKLQPGMIFTDRADDQRRPARHPLPRRRLDHRHRRSLAFRAVGAHGAGDARRLRGADRVGRHAAASARALSAVAPRRHAMTNAAVTAPPLSSAGRRRRRGDQRWRDELKLGRDALRGGILRASRHAARCCASMRAWSTACCRASGPSSRRHADIALVAVGGYGRGQLFPHSDVDVLMLLPRRARTRRHVPSSSASSAMLWDIGLEIGHSVRTIAECEAEMAGDVTDQDEPPRASADRRLAHALRAFRTAFDAALDVRAFYEAKALEQQQRHLKYHDTAYNLEPNVKESPGGLRDLQTVLWIARAAGLGRVMARAGEGGPHHDRARRARCRGRSASSAALRVRLHYLAGRREDRLVFDQQNALARELGLVDTRDEARERAADAALLPRGEARAPGQRDPAAEPARAALPGRAPSRVPIDDDFQSVDELARHARRGRCSSASPAAMLDAFLTHAAASGAEGHVGAHAARAVAQPRIAIDAAFRRDPRESRALHADLSRAARPHARAAADEPVRDPRRTICRAFGRIVGQMQHDLFHVYTVDEHILMVIRNLRRFTEPQHAHEYPLCSRLIGRFRAQGGALSRRTVPRHRQGPRRRSFDARARATRGASAARTACSPRTASSSPGSSSSICSMSATAQKQDITDPDVVAAFARQGRHRAPADRALPAHRRRHPRHEPQGLERVEGEAARGPVPRDARAACRQATRAHARRQPARAAARTRSGCCASTRCPTAPSRRCGDSSTPSTSSATRPTRSRGTRATSTGASTARRRSSRRASRAPARACRCWSTCPTRRISSRGSAASSAGRAVDPRGEDPHDAPRLCARHLRRPRSGEPATRRIATRSSSSSSS